MAMYDYIKVDVERLPISEKEKEFLKDTIFQTKSLRNAFISYIIDKNNTLFYTIPFHKEEKQEFFHGYITFYDQTDFYFRAKFTDGICTYIERWNNETIFDDL